MAVLFDACRAQRVLERSQMTAGDILIGDDGGQRARQQRGDPRADSGKQAVADGDVVAAVAKRDMDLGARRAGVQRAVIQAVPFGPVGERLDDILDDRSVRDVAAVDGDIGGGIDRIALFDEPRHDGGRIVVIEQRPVGAAAHALHEQGKIGTQPDRNAGFANATAGFLVHEGAAAGRHDLGAAVEQSGDDLALAFAEIGLAMIGEDLGNALSGGEFDLVVGIDEGNAELFGEPAADGGLAGAHQADKDDRVIAQPVANELDFLD